MWFYNILYAKNWKISFLLQAEAEARRWSRVRLRMVSCSCRSLFSLSSSWWRVVENHAPMPSGSIWIHSDPDLARIQWSHCLGKDMGDVCVLSRTRTCRPQNAYVLKHVEHATMASLRRATTNEEMGYRIVCRIRKKTNKSPQIPNLTESNLTTEQRR